MILLRKGRVPSAAFFVDKKGENCLLSSAEVTSEDLAELDAAYGAGAKADGYAVCARCDDHGVLYYSWQL